MENVIINKSKIVIEQCCQCGIDFGIPEDFRNTLIDNGKYFCCPNGHSQYYNKRKSLDEKLKIKEDQLKTERMHSNMLYEEKENYRRSAASQKGQKTKILNRIKNGVCPHCNRSFQNLHEHMKTEHAKNLT